MRWLRRLGRVLQVDTPQELYEHPASRFVADFIGSVTLAGTATGSAAQGPVAVQSPTTQGGGHGWRRHGSLT